MKRSGRNRGTGGNLSSVAPDHVRNANQPALERGLIGVHSGSGAEGHAVVRTVPANADRICSGVRTTIPFLERDVFRMSGTRKSQEREGAEPIYHDVHQEIV
jgi:hypothetical protein